MLCPTDTSVLEKEGVCVVLVDLDDLEVKNACFLYKFLVRKMQMAFFLPDQQELMTNVVCLALDWESVNTGSNNSLIKQMKRHVQDLFGGFFIDWN